MQKMRCIIGDSSVEKLTGTREKLCLKFCFVRSQNEYSNAICGEYILDMVVIQCKLNKA